MSLDVIKCAKKVEINPTYTQKQKTNQTIGNCRFVYNFFIAENKRLYESLHPKKFEEDSNKKSNEIKFDLHSTNEKLGYKAKQKKATKYKLLAKEKKKQDKTLGNKKSKTKTEPKKSKHITYNGKTPKEYLEFLNPGKSYTYINANNFEKWMNNEFLPKNPDYSWIKVVSSKAIKKSLTNAHSAFQDFFKNKKGYPNFKKKNDQDTKCYFVKNNPTDCKVQRDRIKIPTLGWVKVKEFGYIKPSDNISSITVSQKANKYYVSVTMETKVDYSYIDKIPYTDGIGIDLGIKEFIVTNNPNIRFKNINKSKEVKRLEKKLKREQRKLSKKYEMYKKTKNNMKTNKDNEKFEYIGKNINKQILVIQKIHKRLTNIREDYLYKVANEIIKNRPKYITIEDLNIKGMMKNKHLSKAIRQQNFYKFKTILISLCKKYKIQLRQVDRFYPSSKLCNNCHTINKELKLKDRTFKCSCGYTEDRDVNAGKNLKDATKYKILVA